MPVVFETSEPAAGKLVFDDGKGGVVFDDPPSGRLLGGTDAVISAAPDKSAISRALTSVRESLSPLIGYTQNQKLAQGQAQMALEQDLPTIAQHIEANPSGLMQTEGAMPAMFTPSKNNPVQLPVISGLPDVPGLGMNNPAVLQGIYNPVAGAVNSAIASPGGLLTLPLSGPLRAAPAIGRIVSGAFGADMARQTIENAPQALRTVMDPNATTAEKTEAIVGTGLTAGLGALSGMHALETRLKGKTPEQQSKAIREEIKVTEDKKIADALTDAADSIDRDIAAAKALEDQQKAAEKAATDQQRAIEQQNKAAADQQKQVADAQAKAAEVPKSTQILAESAKPPPLANIATEVGTQTSPYAVQGKLNEMTAQPPPHMDQIPGPAQGPAPMLSEEALAGRQRASAMRRGRDAGPVLEEIAPPEQVNNAKANFERRKAIFDANKRAEAEAKKAQQELADAAADEAKWMSEQKALAEKSTKVGKGTPAPVEFVGIQEGLPAFEGRPATPSNELFNLTQDIPGHPVGSTLSRKTLESYGYDVPKNPQARIDPLIDFDSAWKKGGEISGGENQVVMDNGRVFKRAYNPTSKEVLSQHKTIEALQQYVSDHNAVFPETEIRIEGMSKTPHGEAPVTSQVEVIGSPAKPAEIEAMMKAKGFEKRGRLFVNDEAGIRVGDLTADNVIKTADGQLRVIDAAIKRFTPKPEGINRAVQIESPASEVLRPEVQGAGVVVELPRVVEANRPEASARNVALKEAGREPTITGPDNRYDLIKGLSESKLVALSKQLGVDPKGMSGERLRSRVASNAREADIVDALANPVAEVTAPKKGRIRGSSASKWADQVIKERGPGSGAVNTLDPQILAAYTIRLAEQLESGAVKFGEWSKRMIDELGEQVRPVLSRIWEEAHTKAGKEVDTPPEPRIISGAEENRAQSEAATGHEYLKDTNKAQEESGQRYVDYVKKTQDWEGAIDAVERIPHTADRSVAVSQLLAEANRTLNTPDTLPEFDRLVNRLAPQVLGEKTELGQGLQSQQVVNRIMEPLRPYLGWRRMIQTRLSELASKFPKESAELINKGMKDAGNEAAKKLNEKTPSDNSVINQAIDRVKKTGADIDKIFTDLPENQEARKKEVFDRINSDPAVEKLSPESRKKLADAMEKAWQDLRNKIFRREFDKVIKLPNIGREQREVLEKSLPKIVERANLGLLDNEAFLNAIGERYGIEGIDGPTGKKLRDLGQKAARAPEGIERNEIYQQIMDTIMEARGVNAGDFLKDYWYRNVMSAPRTAFEIGSGGIVQGMARTFTTAVDTATALKRPDIALRMIGMFLKDAATGARLGYDLVKTGDRAILPRYKEQFLSKMERLEQGKSPGGEIESLYRRSGPAGKVALAPFELTGRVLTGLDYIGGQGVRSQQMLYSSLVKGDKASFESAMRRFNQNEVKSAEQQARTEIGPEARPAQVIARSREILNEGISKDIQAFGNNMTEVTALNAPPVGLGGEIYKAVSQIPMVIRAPSGLAFAKAAINLIQESSNWAPITGQMNVARSLWRNPSKNNPFRFLALDKLPPERARQLIVAQGTGLALMLAAANKFLSDQPEDKEGKPRSMEISGGWDGLTQTQKAALMSAGEKPFAIKMPDGRWVDYKLTPFVASLATIGHWRDQQRFKGAKWNDEALTNKVGNAWLSGLGAVRDLSVSSQFSSLAGHMLASDNREMDTNGFLRTLTDTAGNAAIGLLPMSSLLRELDQTDDPQRYRPGKNNPGVDLWLTQIPFARRTVGDGPLLNFLGRPVNVEVNPFNRHIGSAPSTDPVTSALSEKVSLGMKLPALADNTSITELKNGKLEKRPMTDEESYNYQKAVRQGFARQLANDLPAFTKATPEQAALYSQLVFTDAERYARDRLNTGAKFDGTIPVNPKLSSALSPDYQRVKEMDASDSSQSAIDRSNIRVKYQEMMALPPEQRMSAIRDVAINNPELARKFLQHIASPSTERNALEKATGGLDAPTRAEFFIQELAKRQTPTEKQAFINQQLKAGLITKEVLRQMADQAQRN